jgi:adenylate cyclase class IV
LYSINAQNYAKRNRSKSKSLRFSHIEVEKITEGEGDDVQEELFTFLETLGVTREDRVINGYDTLMYQQQNA